MRRCSSMTPLNLLCLSSRGGLAFLGCCGAVEVAVDLAGEVALEASTDLAEGAAFSGSALNVGAGGRVHAHAGDDGHVERAVEATVTAAVDAVSDGVAGRRRNRVHAGEAGERRFGSDAAQVRPRGQRHRGGDRADAGLLEQSAGGALVDQVGDALGDLLEVVVERRHAFGQPDGRPSGWPNAWRRSTTTSRRSPSASPTWSTRAPPALCSNSPASARSPPRWR